MLIAIQRRHYARRREFQEERENEKQSPLLLSLHLSLILTLFQSMRHHKDQEVHQGGTLVVTVVEVVVVASLW